MKQIIECDLMEACRKALTVLDAIADGRLADVDDMVGPTANCCDRAIYRAILKAARSRAVMEELLKACQLVLAIHDHPEQQAPQWRINLDPKAYEQIANAVKLATTGEQQ